MEITKNIEDFANLKIGEKLCYHFGNLAGDRLDDAKLHELADWLLTRSTARTTYFDKGVNLRSGDGQFELFQTRNEYKVCLYWARRRKFV